MSSSFSTKIPVGILGATGMVGQRFIERLQHHPYFSIAYLAASERSAGKAYHQAAPWRLSGFNPIENFPVSRCSPQTLPSNVRLVFSALDSSVAKDIEQAYRNAGCFVVSNASAWRMDSNTPLLVPEINAEHLSLLGESPTSGILTNPNCCAIPLSLSLAPLRPFGIEAVCVSTYQSVSGAGYPGESAWDMVANVHPHAGNEEEKLAIEPQKILGDADSPADFPISARCVRVPTADGHLLGVQVKLKSKPTPADVRQAILSYTPSCPALPSSPKPLYYVHTRRDRPSPRFDIMLGDGMAISIGRIEPCAVMGIKFFALSHNTIRGAAGAAIANAELLYHRGLIQTVSS